LPSTRTEVSWPTTSAGPLGFQPWTWPGSGTTRLLSPVLTAVLPPVLSVLKVIWVLPPPTRSSQVG
jgi:hypothetical protein